MSGIEWTQDRPTKPGLYWYYDNAEDEPQILRVEDCKNSLWATGGDIAFSFEKCPQDFDCIHGMEYWSTQPIAMPGAPFIQRECTCEECKD